LDLIHGARLRFLTPLKKAQPEQGKANAPELRARRCVEAGRGLDELVVMFYICSERRSLAARSIECALRVA
jgi:hypothetical protein